VRGVTDPKPAAKRLHRRRTVRFVAVALALAALAGLIAPLALPDQEGIPRAVAGSPSNPGSGNTGSTTPTTTTSGVAPHRRRHGSPPPGPQASVTIGANESTTPVPSSFFGISTEYWSLTPSMFESNTPVFERVLALLHVKGNGPLVLRIGGDSADHSFWHPPWKHMPTWAFALTPRYLARVRGLVLRDRVKLIVDLNLVTDTPLTAAAWAHAAETALPHGSIVGFEVGNEPDLYSRRYWVRTLASSPLLSDSLPFELTPPTYVQDFADYARVIGEHAPDIPLVGPAVAHPRSGLPYISTLIEDERPELGAVSAHLYPYSACVKRPRAPDYPTVARLLSRAATSDFSTYIASAVTAAHTAGLKFRLTEFNSVTCGGKPGVSNTFATALWAPDALFTAMRAGADGANLHVRASPSAVNAPFAITRGGLNARPLLYGLALFTRMLGPQARLVRPHLVAPPSLNLSAWAVRVRGGLLHVLLINKSSRSVRVNLHLPATQPASVQRLLAPSPYSRTGVTLNGQHLNYTGRWSGTPRTRHVSPGPRGGYTVLMPRRSAALVTVKIGAPRTRRHAISKHHRRVAVTKHAVLAVSLDRPRKH
jgi:hypothetical protein